jgi:hypothetical protein
MSPLYFPEQACYFRADTDLLSFQVIRCNFNHIQQPAPGATVQEVPVSGLVAPVADPDVMQVRVTPSRAFAYPAQVGARHLSRVLHAAVAARCSSKLGLPLMCDAVASKNQHPAFCSRVVSPKATGAPIATAPLVDFRELVPRRN